MPRTTTAIDYRTTSEYLDALAELRTIFGIGRRPEWNYRTDDGPCPAITAVLMHVGDSRNGYPARTWRFFAPAALDRYNRVNDADVPKYPTILEITERIARVMPGFTVSNRAAYGIRTQEDPEIIVHNLAALLYHDDPYASRDLCGTFSHGIGITRITP